MSPASAMSQCKSSVLVVGFGAIGTLVAYNLEIGGLATVTGVLRSNYDVVMEHGIAISSVDHGNIASWRPANACRAIPNLKLEASERPYDFIVVCTKNTPDIPPTVADMIQPAVTLGHTAIVLIQNGINIEKPIIAAFPSNIVISGISRMSSRALGPANILQQGHDTLVVGAFNNTNLPEEVQQAAARNFVHLYNTSGKVTCQYEENVAFCRWRKLVYNASFNSVCAITCMDASSIKMAATSSTELLLPIMLEIKSISRASGVRLPPDQEETSLASDPLDRYFRPSMLQDIEKDAFMEIEVIIGEPVREAQLRGVPAPTLTFVYSFLKVLQERVKQRKGMVTMPPAQIV